MQFTRAIVRTPCRNMIHGLTEAGLGKPDYDCALKQHSDYISALQYCGLQVTLLEADENFPDSTFVEDTAVLTPCSAIISRPGASSRRGEIRALETELQRHFKTIEHIEDPGTLDGGDIMMVGSHYFIGLSRRTNEAGAKQLIRILGHYGYSASTIRLKELLHLKSGLSYLENNLLVISDEFLRHPEFKKFKQIPINSKETYAANCVWINGCVLVSKGFPKTKEAIEKTGYPTIVLDMSEFRKLDGGLSCLSLRF